MLEIITWATSKAVVHVISQIQMWSKLEQNLIYAHFIDVNTENTLQKMLVQKDNRTEMGFNVFSSG